jgi:hypothetical protein
LLRSHSLIPPLAFSEVIMDNMVAKLDRLYPLLKRHKPCTMCGRQSTDVHHIIGRDNILLRFDLNNLLPLCRDCHRLVHKTRRGALDYISWSRADYLETMANVQFQDYLLANGLTREEFFKIKEKELMEEICNA